MGLDHVPKAEIYCHEVSRTVAKYSSRWLAILGIDGVLLILVPCQMMMMPLMLLLVESRTLELDQKPTA